MPAGSSTAAVTAIHFRTSYAWERGMLGSLVSSIWQTGLQALVWCSVQVCCLRTGRALAHFTLDVLLNSVLVPEKQPVLAVLSCKYRCPAHSHYWS